MSSAGAPPGSSVTTCDNGRRPGLRDPGELHPSEEWIHDLFAPTRLMLYNCPCRPTLSFMPDEALSADAAVATLIA